MKLINRSDCYFGGYGYTCNAAELKAQVASDRESSPEGIRVSGFGGEGWNRILGEGR